MGDTAKKWKIYVIHHSHTDIGYTERQEKIEQYHVDFIKQAVAICDAAHDGERKEWEGYKWTCEQFWAVERFLEKASAEEQNRFANALRRGDIELSGNYLNMTELANFELLRKMMVKAGSYAKSINLQVPVKSAMTADINGYSWGYSQALADAGIENLLTCIHTHHGMFATGRKQYPFYWETPKGNRLLVWSGEHYMFGNDLGLNPEAGLSYTILDEHFAWGITENPWQFAEDRIFRYINQLEKEQYPYDFALVNVMGLLRDNAAPNARVITFIKEWNEKYGDRVEVEMTTLNRYFDLVREQSFDIPVYRGDWPDWWSDGVNSTAMHTQIFRDAQRKLEVIRKLDPKMETVCEDRIRDAEYQLMMYAEHTWGYHSSVTEPWHQMVQQLGARKEAYAANGSRLVYTALDDVLKHLGEVSLHSDRRFTYRVVNPYDYPIEDIAHFYLDHWELASFKKGFEVVEELTGRTVPHQLESVSKGNQIEIVVKLAAGEFINYVIRHSSNVETKTTSSTQLTGRDRVYDLTDLILLEEPGTEQKLKITEHSIENPYLKLVWAEGEGIFSWYDKSKEKEWIAQDRLAGAFSPVYERTPVSDVGKMGDVRRIMGRNRKGIDVQRSFGKLSHVKTITNGTIYSIVELTYNVHGMSHYSVFLKVYTDLARVDVSVRIHKDSVWEPENVFVSLPFTQENSELWLDKAGALVRPGKDQLPGTLIDFYCIQEGLALLSPNGSLLLSTPDTPLLQTGSIKHEPRKLNGQQQGEQHEPLYSWALSNYWETNFKATIGGFYEFRYSLQFSDQWESPERPIEICHATNTGTVAYRTI